MYFSCQSFVLKPLFFPLTNASVLKDLKGPIKVKRYQTKSFVLDVSMEMPNLSANADRPITGNVLKCQFENTHIRS